MNSMMLIQFNYKYWTTDSNALGGGLLSPSASCIVHISIYDVICPCAPPPAVSRVGRRAAGGGAGGAGGMDGDAAGGVLVPGGAEEAPPQARAL